MVPNKTKLYLFLSLTLASVSLAAVALYFILLLSQNAAISLAIGLSTLSVASFGLHLGYMLLVFPFLYKKLLVSASMIGSMLFSIAAAGLLLGSGGFNSPYFGLWILLIIGVSIFNRSLPLALITLSSLYFFGKSLSTEFAVEFIRDAAIPLASLYLAASLGYWLWRNQHIQLKTTTNLNALSNRLSQEQLKAELLLRDIGDGVIVVDTNDHIQLLNPAGAVLTGWQPDEAANLDYRLVLHLGTEDNEPLNSENNPFALARREKKSIIKNDVVLTSHSGKKSMLSLIVSPIFAQEGNVSGVIGIFRDISAEKAATRQRDEFISTASHEMRTPVAAIDGYIALALNEKVATIDEKARLYLKKAQESTNHLGKLFQDLLTTTKLEDGRIQSNPEPIELKKVIQEVFDELRFKAEAKNIQLILSSGLESVEDKVVQPLYYVYADRGQLQEVITNLVDNAIKFTPQGNVTITLGANEHNITVGVHDTGIGIAPEDQMHLFQKFYRIDSSKTRTIGGTGLGLYIARTIVELHNGRIWIESKPDGGSHFYVSLPRLNTQQVQTLQNQQPIKQVPSLVGLRPANPQPSQPIVAPVQPIRVE
jgi:PAS domain S-box-containing protein